MIRYAFILLACVMISGCKSSKNIKEDTSGMNFNKEVAFTTQLDLALAEHKLVFLDFYTDWCLPCKMMDEDVFSDKTISTYFEKNFINVKVDAEKGEGPDLTVIYNVKSFPTLLFVDEKGRVILRKEGLTYHTELKQFAEHAISIWENQ